MNELWLWHILFLSFFQDYNDPCPYSLSPVTIKSQKLLRSPRKATRKISRIPFKVLDAPELQDDFYLNLVDWSAQNVLAVGLGSCVYLWSACTSQVSQTITQRTFYHLLLGCGMWNMSIRDSRVCWAVPIKTILDKRHFTDKKTFVCGLGDKIVWFEQRWKHSDVGVMERTWTPARCWNPSRLCNGLGCSGQQTGKHKHKYFAVAETMKNVSDGKKKKNFCVLTLSGSSSTKAKPLRNDMQICLFAFLFSWSQKLRDR